MRQVLGEYLTPRLLESVELLVSELITNSVTHGGLDEASWIEVSMNLEDNVVRVEVADPGTGFEFQKAVITPDQTSGWGLLLVDKIAQRWGVVNDGQTHVWFEINNEANNEVSSAS